MNKSMIKQGQCKKTLPHASATSSGAQVASQQSLILQTGNKKIT